MEKIQELFDKGELSYKDQPKVQAAMNVVTMSCVSCCATSIKEEADDNDNDNDDDDEENDTFELLTPNPAELEEPQEN